MLIRATVGATSRRSCRRLPAISGDDWKLRPVMLPSGRAKLVTNPRDTGSVANAMTMGIVLVARCAACTAGSVAATMMSTLSCTSSAARPANPSFFPCAHRHSSAMVCPSTYPSSLSPRRRAKIGGEPSGDCPANTPTRGILLACCAGASGAARSRRATAVLSRLTVSFTTIPPPVATPLSPMNPRWVVIAVISIPGRLNVRNELLGAAGATQDRRLFTVSSMPLSGSAFSTRWYGQHEQALNTGARAVVPHLAQASLQVLPSLISEAPLNPVLREVQRESACYLFDQISLSRLRHEADSCTPNVGTRVVDTHFHSPAPFTQIGTHGF